MGCKGVTADGSAERLIDAEPAPPEASVAASASRLDRIVLAAGELLETMPIREVTTTRIAERADVAISTLYRFSPDRDAIFAEIISRTIGRVENFLELFAVDKLQANGNLAYTIDVFADFMTMQPGFRPLWAGGYLMAGKVPAWDALRRACVQAGYEAVTRQGVPGGPELMRRLQLMAAATDHCQRLAMNRPEPERSLLLAELRRMVRLGLSWETEPAIANSA